MNKLNTIYNKKNKLQFNQNNINLMYKTIELELSKAKLQLYLI